MSKKLKVTRPTRDPDHYSKRGVPYWWAPEWVRGTSADDTDHEKLANLVKNAASLDWQQNCILSSSGSYVYPCENYGRIYAVVEKGTANLYMKSKEGNLTFIQGSIQQEFRRWHEDRSIDYMLLGMDPDEILNEQA